MFPSLALCAITPALLPPAGPAAAAYRLPPLPFLLARFQRREELEPPPPPPFAR
jgi:hypothetical protein